MPESKLRICLQLRAYTSAGGARLSVAGADVYGDFVEIALRFVDFYLFLNTKKQGQPAGRPYLCLDAIGYTNGALTTSALISRPRITTAMGEPTAACAVLT